MGPPTYKLWGENINDPQTFMNYGLQVLMGPQTDMNYDLQILIGLQTL